mmetsp:Transcript_22562/g.49904  ORF Transcript_22562/g.49904 Transcript_22562/m.49904 type:complete len:318 (+) Transcript_22562:54-1007(+)
MAFVANVAFAVAVLGNFAFSSSESAPSGHEAQSTLKCGTTLDTGTVIHLSDGTYQRCASVITPQSANGPMPVLFWFHGAGGSAASCGTNQTGELAKLGEQHGFVLICGEALQHVFGRGGFWTIPEIITDATGTPCEDGDSLEVPYVKAILAWLAERPETYDTSRLFFSGCSMGSGLSNYITTCMKRLSPANISAFATHSTGLKQRGDGLKWPHDIFHPQYMSGECPGCQYFPAIPEAHHDRLGLKACIFDNREDPSEEDPSFYESSLALAKAWFDLGNRAETHFLHGGHCEIHSFADIVTCLDDGTGRLKSSEVVLV